MASASNATNSSSPTTLPPGIGASAYADSHDGERYAGLRACEPIAAVAPSGLVVAAAAAAEQRSREQAASGETEPGAGAVPGPGVAQGLQAPVQW